MKKAMLGWVIPFSIASGAHAQSSVTLFGLLDVGVSYVSNEQGGHSLKADDSIWTPSLWGIRGVEDLGGGYKTLFDLESQFAINTGAGIPGPNADFNRQAFVGIEKDGMGRLTFGQQYNLMADFLFFPPAKLDASFMYGGLYNMRQGPFSALGIPQNPTGSFDFDQMAGTSRVSNSAKFVSATFSGLRLGALYGFGNTAGSFSSNNTVGFGVDYAIGSFGIGAAYNETQYQALDNGHDGIRNFGGGISQAIGDLYLSALYTNTKNTLTGGMVQVVQAGGLYAFNPFWRLGANYQYMKGNAALSHNRAQQITSALQYSLSKRTTVYTEGVFQWTGGDVEGSHNAWINGAGQSRSDHQFIARLGLQTIF
ncbi:porin (plasmid) [Paraburkholderia sp. D15]|uniref:porin n=1 Tax=Paraburkholderia sp. D15 TaxID=2880218 RepID=UPI00247A882E|nr:porin [Paraburkholderia sp. D15]WGS55175.1 porin [Paraburkholderia sp. D15]